jgi:hypothetical protein
MNEAAPVPAALRVSFVIHFWADIVAAVPLFVAPVYVLELLGWQTVDPVATRLVAAALFGIGIESLLARNAGRATYRGMLNLKVIWSAAATMGLAWGLVDGAHGRPLLLWAAFGIFLAFHILWLYWRVKLGRAEAS